MSRRPKPNESPADFAAREVRRAHAPAKTRWVALLAAAAWGGAVWFARNRQFDMADRLILAAFGLGTAALAFCRGWEKVVGLIAAVGAGLLWFKVHGG